MIELPFPAKILWPNGRGHHMAKHRAFQKHKEWARLATLSIFPSCVNWSGERVCWSATFYPKTRNAIDRDNAAASLKAYADGIANALGIDDRYFDNPTIHFAEPVKHGKVIIILDSATAMARAAA